MGVFTLNEEEIFFGIIRNEGTRSPLIKKQPTLQELEVLWRNRPDLFCGTCECGHRNYIYAHTITVREDDPGMVARSFLSFHCPACGRRDTKGANYFVGQERIAVMNDFAEKTKANG